MKVLWIGPFRDQSGWADAAANQVLALDAAGVEVVPRTILYKGAGGGGLPGRLLELESRSARGCDVVVQNVLPPSMEYHGGFGRNVAYYFTETRGYGDTDWPRYVGLMDEAWLPCRQNREAARASGISLPLSVVPVAADVTRYERSYTPHRIREDLGDSFVFYTIGEATRRKNLGALVEAFHLEFEPNEPVELVIKTNVPGLGPDQAKAALRKDFDTLKSRLNLYPDRRYYKQEHIFTERFATESVYRLHASCDCYVSAACGEGWGLPAFDAMGFGKTPVVTDFGAHEDYVTPETGWPVPCTPTHVSGMEGHGAHYSGRQSWAAVSVAGLRAAMREAYEGHGARAAKRASGMERVYEFSYEKVGILMKGLLGA